MGYFGRARPLALVAITSAGLLAGCVSDPGSTSSDAPEPTATVETGDSQTPTLTPTPTPTQTSESEAETPEGFDAFAFSAKTINGSSFDVDGLRGQPTVFWFWTPWCTVCRADAPGIASLAADLGDRINFIGVAAQGTASEMVAFASETGVTSFPHLADLDSSIWAHFGVPYQPSFVFVSASGQSTLSVGSRSISELEIELLELIG